MSEKTLIFIDGENLTLRYQEMIKTGKVPRPDNVHIPDCFIWNNRILDGNVWDIKRISYYTSLTGDDDRIREVRERIAGTKYSHDADFSGHDKMVGSGQIVPFVRKKNSRSRKESICDIAIAVDVMRSCYRDHAEIIWMVSGDGDFMSLVEETVHSGKRVYMGALSSGLNEDLKYAVDEFFDLDDVFFLGDAEVEATKNAIEGQQQRKD